ncbi:unnamed protein product [Brachionus calyciflorus]|uniref:Protein HIRA n=1 Tax=Brachionus calyciflorus TaxID=104777 RepID=A0A813USC2_9BILA|nr:unnamed protein product [Brachionus calyciflorus]
MKLFKPYWVNHSGNAIFSIDVHPDGSRFATGGQSNDSGKIVIWNMGPVVDKTKEMDENIPKILCQMDHHIACVNCVRWSNNGFFLASGSDDKLIMIWHYVSGQGGFQNIENWKCGFTLRGHSGDVLDLAWSSTDNYLASCSVDNTIIIWNALKFPDIIKRINAHSGLVKGVVWDPVGHFLASQSDDKTLKIWKTSDWSLEKTIDEPFKDCTGTTHVLRLSWSPDGQTVLSAHAINNGAPTAQVIDRGNKWNTKLDFVGHRKAVTTVRFYPHILKQEDSEKVKTHCLCALGSRDRSVSIWLTNYSRPLCVIGDVFDNPVMDLSWRKEGLPGLLACSMDGTVLYLELNSKDVGVTLSNKETDEFYKTKYGFSLSDQINMAKNNQFNLESASSVQKKTNQDCKFIENADILLAQINEPKKVVLGENSLSNFPFKAFQNSPFKSTSNTTTTDLTEQIERRMPDGRRRITPICVSKPGEYNAPIPFGSTTSTVQIINENFTSSIGFDAPSLGASQGFDPSKVFENKKTENQITSFKSVIQNNIQIETKKQEENVIQIQTEPIKLQKKVLAVRDVTNKPDIIIEKRVVTPIPIQQSFSGTQVVFNGEPTVPTKFNSNLTPSDKCLEPLRMTTQTTRTGQSNDLISVHNQIPFKNQQKSIYFSNESDSNNAHKLNVIKYIQNNKENKQELKWIYYFNEAICDVKLNKSIVACVCQDSCLYLLKLSNGSLICSPIVLDSKAAVLNVSNYSNYNYIMVISEKGFMYLWKFCLDTIKNEANKLNNSTSSNCFHTLTNLIYNESCQFIVEGKTLVKSLVTENGTPVLHLSENKSYYYSIELKCWHLIPLNGSLLRDSLKLLINSNSLFNQSTQNDKTNETPLNYIQSYQKNTSLSKSIQLLYESSEASNDLINKKDFTQVHLESQINAALGLQSAKEYKFWLLTLVRYLVENNYEDKLKDICNSLLGPLYSTSWCEYVLTFKKRDLLLEILPILAQNLELQRLYTSLKEQLNQIEEKAKVPSKKSVLDRIMVSENVPGRDCTTNKIVEMNVDKENIAENIPKELPMES